MKPKKTRVFSPSVHPPPSPPAPHLCHHDGACGVDDVAPRLRPRVHQVDGRQNELLLKMRTALDVALRLAHLHRGVFGDDLAGGTEERGVC